MRVKAEMMDHKIARHATEKRLRTLENENNENK
jgi:hypothetical protein